jgi:hypothetical protein
MEIAGKGEEGSGVSKTLSQPINKNPSIVVCTCHPSYAKSINRITVQAGLSINERPYSKNT